MIKEKLESGVIEEGYRNRLVKFMKKHNKTPYAVAKGVNCHQQTLTNWIKREKTITVQMWDKIELYIKSVE